MDGLASYVKTVVKRFPDYAFDVNRIIATQDFVILHSHATLKAAHRGNEAKGFIITGTRFSQSTFSRAFCFWQRVARLQTKTRLSRPIQESSEPV